MTPRRFLPIALAALLPLLPAAAGPDLPALVAQLGAESWQAREEAQMALIDAGDPALPALKEALSSADPEVRVRARESIDAIESGLSGKAFSEFGNVARAYPEMEEAARRALAERMAATLGGKDRARPFARLASLETAENFRGELVELALRADEALAMTEFRSRLAAKRDDLLLVGIAAWYGRNGRQDDAVKLLDEFEGPLNLPLHLAEELSAIRARSRDWKRAAEAFGALVGRVPAADEGAAAGKRVAFLTLAGEPAAAAAGLAQLLKAGGETCDLGLASGLQVLLSEGRRSDAKVLVTAGQTAGAGGPFLRIAGRFLIEESKEAEALLLFRRALATAQDEATRDLVVEEARNLSEGRPSAGVIDAAFEPELKAAAASSARHGAAADLLARAGLVGPASKEWKRASLLSPGSPLAAAQAARAAAASGDAGAAGWRWMAGCAGSLGWPEERLVDAPLEGRASRLVVRRAAEMAEEEAEALHAVAGDCAARVSWGDQTIRGISSGGLELWKWSWTEPARVFPGGMAQRTRQISIAHLLSLGDAFLVGLQETDTTDDGDGSQVRQEVGEWLVVLDAATGIPRSTSRSPSGCFNTARPAVARGGILVTADPDLATLRAVSVLTGRTLWVRAVDRYREESDPDRIECRPRMACWDDTVVVPSPHGRRVCAFRLEDGAPAWSTRLEGCPTDLAIFGDALYVSAGPWAARLDPASGTVTWARSLGSNLLGAPAPSGDVAGVRTRDGWLRGLNASDGQPRWSLVAGPPASEEWLQPVGEVFFLCRRDAATWAVTRDGTPLRRFYLDFSSSPESWLGTLLCGDTFGRRRPFNAPVDETIVQAYAGGLLRIDAAALVADDAAAVARLADAAPPETALALAAAAVGIDPESPAALRLRARASVAAAAAGTPEQQATAKTAALNDLWRALDALPPRSAEWAAAEIEVRALSGDKDPWPLDRGETEVLWVREERFWNALARLSTGKGDAEAALELGALGFGAALPSLAPVEGAADHNEAVAIARLRLGDNAVVAQVVAVMKSNGRRASDAAEALSVRKEPEVLDALRERMEAGYPVRVRLAAALAWAERKEPAALDLLEQFGIPAADEAIFLRAARLLMAGGREEAMSKLVRAGTERNVQEVHSIVAASGLPGAFDVLAKEVLTGDGEVNWGLMTAMLSHLPAPSNPFFGEALRARKINDNYGMYVASRLSCGEHPGIAEAVLEYALRNGPRDREPADQWLRLLVADAGDVAGKGEVARRHLDEYETLFPDAASTCNNSAWFRAIALTPELRDPGHAVALSLRAVGMEPDSASYWDTLGAAMRSHGDFRAAVFAATRALELAPESGDSCDLEYCTVQQRRALCLEATAGADDGWAPPQGGR